MRVLIFIIEIISFLMLGELIEILDDLEMLMKTTNSLHHMPIVKKKIHSQMVTYIKKLNKHHARAY